MKLQTASFVALSILALGGPASSGSDPAAPVFSPGKVLDIEIKMRPGDFEKLRRQTRTDRQIAETLRRRRKPLRVFSYFPAELSMAGKTLQRVGVRKKGFWGSLSSVKPAFKIKFSHYLPNQRFYGLRRLTLNNAIQDPALIGQCLVYRIFRDAGSPAPRCNFARVKINGDYLGLYVNVESIDRSFLKRRFGSARGNLFEGNASDLRAGWMRSFVRKTNKKSGSNADLHRLAEAVLSPEKDLPAALGRVLDLEAFYKYWALEALVAQTDSYPYNGNNFYLYYDPSKKLFYFIPWGADQVLPDIPAGAGTVYAMSSLLPVRLLAIDSSRRRYERTLRRLLGSVWNERELLARVERTAALVRPNVRADRSAAFERAIAQIRKFIRGRRRVVLAEISRRERPRSGRDISMSRGGLIFAPFARGRSQRLCTRLKSSSGRPFNVTGFEVHAHELKASASKGSGGVRVCVELLAQSKREKRLVRIHTDRADQRVLLLSVRLLQPLGVPDR